MSDKICPRCGENNPHKAVMCWACYTELMPLSKVWKAAARVGIGPYAQSFQEVRREGNRDPIERIFETILKYGARDGASEIRIEPQKNGISIYYRIDGELREQMKVPRYVLPPLVSHIKDVGKMETLDAEHPAEQHGSVHFTVDDQTCNWDVSTQTTAFGEQVVFNAHT